MIVLQARARRRPRAPAGGVIAVRCPFCGHLESKVTDSRSIEAGGVIRRRRQCLGCSRRFTTREKVEDTPLYVVKKDGRREPFDRQKILAGLLKACEKRPVPMVTLEAAAAEIEGEIRGRLEREVSSQDIGELVMERLRGLDEVAYVRFASVYRQFTDIQRFKDELEKLLGSAATDKR
jgi:transcriptional repressor NrdR